MAHILTINVSLISIIEQAINIVNSIKYMYVYMIVQSCICQDYNEVVDVEHWSFCRVSHEYDVHVVTTAKYFVLSNICQHYWNTGTKVPNLHMYT